MKAITKIFFIRFFKEFTSVFSIFYFVLFFITFLKLYAEGKSINIVPISAYSFTFINFLFSISFSFSIWRTMSNMKNERKLEVLKTFGGERFFVKETLILSLIFFSISTHFLYLSPRAYQLIYKNSFSLKKSKYGYAGIINDKIIFAKNIEIKDKIKLSQGFIYDGKKILKFKEIYFNIIVPKTVFTKEPYELIMGDKKEKIWLLYSVSINSSIISTSIHSLSKIGFIYNTICIASKILLYSIAKKNEKNFPTISFLIPDIFFILTILLTLKR